MNIDSIVGHLKYHFERAGVILFSGAGFSQDVKNRLGQNLPSSKELTQILLSLCFPDDNHSHLPKLQDIFEHALNYKKRDLRDLLLKAFSVDPTTIPDYFRTWLSMPWFRSYTLNIDDLEIAAATKFDLPRKPFSISANSWPEGEDILAVVNKNLEVIHLNGTIDDIPDSLTFSTSQYAEKLAKHDPWYQRLSSNIISHPIIFIGTSLDEPPLWQHLALRKTRIKGQSELRPKSYIVTPYLDRARESLLSRFNVEWVNMTTEEFAIEVFGKLTEPMLEGHKFIMSILKDSQLNKLDQSIPLVSILSTEVNTGKSEYLLGSEPSWGDLHSGMAIIRSSDNDLLGFAVNEMIKSGTKNVLVITGTAGSGKSTA